MGWTIKQTVEKTGIPADTLRYYDKTGLLSPRRNGNRYREYDEQDIASLKNIVVMKYAQFSLAEIRRMEEIFDSDPSADCAAVCKEILDAKITELRQVIKNYQKIVVLMEELLPMTESVDAYQKNEDRIDGFIAQIFDDIRSGSLFPAQTTDKKEG